MVFQMNSDNFVIHDQSAQYTTLRFAIHVKSSEYTTLTYSKYRRKVAYIGELGEMLGA
jgi:hypothetical protein